MKKTIGKKLLSLALAVLLTVSILPMTVMEAGASDYTGCMIQHEPEWASYYVNGGSLAATGCGIFSLVNCVGYLTGKTMDVKEVAQWAYQIGAFNTVYGGNGTDRTVLYRKVQAKYGSTYGITVDCDSDGGGYWAGSYNATLQNHLANGGVAIGHVPGHFIALVGFESGKYHVYESSPSDARGTNYNGGDVWVTPAQLASGRLYMDWFCLISSTTKDVTNPVISAVSVSELSASGYTVNCIVTDNFYVERVSFPTWTTKNGQDDLPAQFFTTQLGKRSGNMFSFRVNASAHNYETGEYNTHIYAIDRGGNTTCYEMPVINVRNDSQNPVISDVKISNLSAAGYTVRCKVTDDLGVHKVSFPTWTSYNGQDDLADYFMNTQLGVKEGDYFKFEVKASDHNNELGEYNTHIYAVDCAGNTVCFEIDPINVGGSVALDTITINSSSRYEKEGDIVSNVVASTSVDSFLDHFENEELKVFNKSGKEITGAEKVGTGAVVKLYDGSKVIDSITIIVAGDVDGSGTVDTTDYMRVKSTLVGSFALSNAENKSADVNGSGSVETTDYMRIKSHFQGTYNLYA